MSSESVAESSVPVSAAATVEAGKKRGRPPAGQVTIKLDADTRLHRWNELSSDIAIGSWLDVSHEAKQLCLHGVVIIKTAQSEVKYLRTTKMHLHSPTRHAL